MRTDILLDGFSKTYAMTGWRMGYGVMRADLATHMIAADDQLEFLHRQLYPDCWDRGPERRPIFGRHDEHRVVGGGMSSTPE